MLDKNLKQKIAKSLKNAYIKSPINFSTITGLKYPGIPRLKGNFLLGRLTTLFKKNGILENAIQAGKLAEKHPSGMCYFWLGKQPAILVTRPEDVQALKVTHEKNLSRDVPLIRKAVGASIFTDDRETWAEKRSACNKMMDRVAVEKLELGMKQVIHRYIETLKNHENQSVELRPFFFNMILDVVTTNLMGCPAKTTDSNNKPIQINQYTDLSYFLSETLQEVLQLQNIFKYMLPGFIRKVLFGKADNFDTVRNKMQHRYYDLFLSPNRSNILATENLIKEIWDINHSKNKESGYSDKEILGDGLVLLVGGIATTVVTLEFIIKLLTVHPDKMEKLQKEIQTHVRDNEVTLEALKQMNYLDMIIKETLRLYPPAPLLMPREIESYTEINGIPFFRGDTPIFSAYVIHRSKKYWEEPEEFIPERFSKENLHKINMTAYFPFSLGPRFCAGREFAKQEMKLILAALFSRYRITVENNSFELTIKQGGMAAAVPPVGRIKRILG